MSDSSASSVSAPVFPEASSTTGAIRHNRFKKILTPSTGTANATNGLFGHNFRRAEFGAVRDAISLMTRFAPGHPFFLEDTVASDAIYLLALIEDYLSVEAPKIFPQDDETLVMKWARGQVERLLSLTDEDLTILERHAGSRMRCIHEDDHRQGFDLGAVFSSMGNAFTTTTQFGGEDA